MKRKGFTLVELSIVLVIIGLLIGGILAARSMIETVRVLNFGRQIQQYDIMVSNFQTKYNYLPGDSPAFNPGGNGDGAIQATSTAVSGYPNTSDGEIQAFWPHLYQAGMLQDNNTYVASGPTIQCKLNSPCITSFPLQAVPLAYTVAVPSLIAYSQGGETYWQTMSSLQANWNFLGRFYTPQQAFLIDAKFDDAIMASGKIQAVGDYYSSVPYSNIYKYSDYYPYGNTMQLRINMFSQSQR